MDNITTGSCLCTRIRYRIQGPLRPVVACHCSQCRKTSGHYAAATQCAGDDIVITGDSLRWYKSSDVAERGFCAVCGSNLFWRQFHQDRLSIWAGTIDGATGLRLERQLHAESKGDYYDLPDVPRFPPETLA